MSGKSSPGAGSHGDSELSRWGCLLFGLAAVLLAAQRAAGFSLLAQLSEQGSQGADQALQFLFGQRPFSLFDILLGLELPDENASLLALLQLRTMAIAVIQALHYGVNCLVVYGFFRAVSWIGQRWWRRPLHAGAGCAAVIAALLAIVGCCRMCYATRATWLEWLRAHDGQTWEMTRYENDEWGIAFDCLESLEWSTEVSREKLEPGLQVTVAKITGVGPSAPAAYVVRIIESPLLEETYPNHSAPDEATLRSLALEEMTFLDTEESADTLPARLRASQDGIVGDMAGFPAISYAIRLELPGVGEACVRGAVIVTHSRYVAVYAMASTGQGNPFSVEPEELDQLWEALAASLVLDY
jgi:hypothetical protein